MKKNNSLEISKLAKNIELSLQAKNDSIVAFTTDCKKFDMISIVRDIVKVYVNEGKKVLILGYDNIHDLQNSDYLKLTNVDNGQTIAEKCVGYDLTVVECPDMLTDNSYLILGEAVKNLVIIAKKWQSKIPNIKKIKEKALSLNMDILGIVYQK